MKISTYIEQDLEARIRKGASLPEKLTLGGIALTYGVSATPVRRAVDGLIEKKLMVRQPNGRLSTRPARAGGRLARSASTEAPEPVISNAALEHRVVEELVHIAVSGRAGFIREEPMAERVGVGRTRVREVLTRLAGGGLLEHVPRRGWQVPAFRMGDMDAYIDVRESLELRALDLARPHIEGPEIERMLAGNTPRMARDSRINNDLHSYFIACSRNRYIESFFETNGHFYTALFDYATLSSRAVTAMAEQHVEILVQVKAQRWTQAREALSHHIRAQKPILETMIAAQQAAN